jgi:hypothetical protein
MAELMRKRVLKMMIFEKGREKVLSHNNARLAGSLTNLLPVICVMLMR